MKKALAQRNDILYHVVNGDVTDCEISDDEREQGVNINDLVL